MLFRMTLQYTRAFESNGSAVRESKKELFSSKASIANIQSILNAHSYRFISELAKSKCLFGRLFRYTIYNTLPAAVRTSKRPRRRIQLNATFSKVSAVGSKDVAP